MLFCCAFSASISVAELESHGLAYRLAYRLWIRLICRTILGTSQKIVKVLVITNYKTTSIFGYVFLLCVVMTEVNNYERGTAVSQLLSSKVYAYKNQ